jgi:CO/xanthine dehydrogenase Mo-binding subunit
MATESLWTSLKSGGFGHANRRDFMKITGTGMGLLLVCSAASPLVPKAAAEEHGPPPFAKDFNAYFHIDPSGKITGFVGKVEIGSGQRTVLSQVMAEELDVPVSSIDMVMGDTERCPWDMGTFGSLTFNLFQTFYRASLAEARAVLLQMASEKLGTPVDKLPAGQRRRGQRCRFAFQEHQLRQACRWQARREAYRDEDIAKGHRQLEGHGDLGASCGRC